MFSPEKIIYSLLDNNTNKTFISLSWQKLFKEFFCILYFQNQLFKHSYKPHQVTICLNETISLEVLNLLNTLAHKYSFFKLRQSEPQNTNIDLEKNYLLNSDLNSSKILTSNTCLLIGINPRYEGSKLNLKLRSRYLKGNFNILKIGSLLNLTFSNTNLTSNTQTLKSLTEGNSLICQELVNCLNPILISNTELFKRKDSFCLTNILDFLIDYINLFSQSNNKSQLNILNATLSDVGLKNFNRFKPIEKKDFKNSFGIYFINNSFLTPNLNKWLNLKLLNFFQDYKQKNKILITQSNNLETKLLVQFKKNFNINNHLHLPNTVIFESSGTYINTEGYLSKITKVLTPLGQVKSD